MNGKESTSRTSPNKKFHTTSKKQKELCRRNHALSPSLPRHSSLSRESEEMKIWAYILPTKTHMIPTVLEMMSAKPQQLRPLLRSNEQIIRELSTMFFPAMILTLPLKIRPEGREQIRSLLRLVGDQNLASIAGIRFSGPPYSDYIVSSYGVVINHIGLNTEGATTTLFKTIRKSDGSLQTKRFEDHAGYTADIHDMVNESHLGHCRTCSSKTCSRQEVYNMFSDARFLDSFSGIAKRVLKGCVDEGRGGPSGRHVLAVVDCVMEAYHDEYEPWLPFERRSGIVELA